MSKENKNNVLDHPTRHLRPVSAERGESDAPKPNYMLRRIGAGAALLAAVAAGAGVAKTSLDYLHSDEATPEATATAFANATVELGASETDWGHGAAEKAIKLALAKGLADVSVDTGDRFANPIDVTETIENISIYEQADEALEMAHYNEILPDEGDKLSVKVEVTLDSEQNVSYEVTDAEILDLPNNQG